MSGAKFMDRTVSAEPIRYTAATMEMMRLEDLHHINCAVSYAHDHSHGHGAIQVSKNYFAEKEWAIKDQRKAKEFKRAWRKDPDGTRDWLLRRAKDNLHPPYAWDGDEFYGHKEASCMAYVTKRGKLRAELTGMDVEGSKPCFSRFSPVTRAELAKQPLRPKLPHSGSYSPRSKKMIHPLSVVEAKFTRSTRPSNSRPPSAPMTRAHTGEFPESSSSSSAGMGSESLIGPKAISECAMRVAKRIQKMSSSSSSSVRPSSASTSQTATASLKPSLRPKSASSAASNKYYEPRKQPKKVVI